MAALANTPYVLKMLSGPHQGAEVLIPLGDTSIGSSLDCDIILSDSMLAAVHFHLIVGPSAIEVLAQGADVFCQGKRVPEGQTAKLKNFEFISIGTTHMVVGPSEGEWPNLTAADAPVLFTDTLETDNPEQTQDEPIQNEQSVSQENQHEAQNQLTGFGDRMLQDPPEASTPVEWFLKLNFWVRASLIAVVCLVLCSGVWAVIRPYWVVAQNSAPSVDITAIQDRIQTCMDQLNISAELACSAVGNTVVVYGYVKSQEQKTRLVKALEKLDTQIILKIYSEDVLAQEGQQLMQQYGLKVTIKADGPGKLLVSGYAADVAVWERACGMLLNDLSGIQDIDDQVLTGQKIQAQVAKILEPLNLASRITIAAQPQQIIALGIITEASVQSWQQAREQITQFLNDVIPLKDQVRISDSVIITQNYFDNQLEMISVQSPRWISLQNGQKYFMGATLPSGYMIVDINDAGITLKRGTEHVKLNLRSI